MDSRAGGRGGRAAHTQIGENLERDVDGGGGRARASSYTTKCIVKTQNYILKRFILLYMQEGIKFTVLKKGT